MSWLMRTTGRHVYITDWAGKLDRVAADSKGGVWAVANRPGVMAESTVGTRNGRHDVYVDGRSCQTIRFTPKKVALLSGNPLYTAPTPSGIRLQDTNTATSSKPPTAEDTMLSWKVGRCVMVRPHHIAVRCCPLRRCIVEDLHHSGWSPVERGVHARRGYDRGGLAATKGGVARFDGEKWLVFTSQNSPIKHDDVSSVAVAPDGKVWFGSWNWIASFTYDNGTSVAESPARPALLSIAGVFPNPFNASAIIRFSLPSAGRTHLSVFDITGRKVRDLVSDFLPAGGHTVLWNGLDRSGRRAASGVYFVRLSSGGGAITRKMLLVK